MKKISYLLLILISQQISCGYKEIQTDIIAESASISNFFIGTDNQIIEINDTINIYYFNNKILYEIVNVFYEEKDDTVRAIPNNEFYLEIRGDTTCKSLNSQLKFVNFISQKELYKMLFFKNTTIKKDSLQYEYKRIKIGSSEVLLGKKKININTSNPSIVKFYLVSKYEDFKTKIGNVFSSEDEMKIHRFEAIYPIGTKFSNVVLSKEMKFKFDLKKKDNIDRSIIKLLKSL